MHTSIFTLYAYTFRSRAERVLWALRELDYAHEVIRLDPFKGETRTQEFLQLNPARKIPVLIHGDEVLTESMAIMEYLNDISKDCVLIPTIDKAAYHYRKVIHYGLTEIEPYLWIADQASRLKTLYKWPAGSYEEALRQVLANIEYVWPWLQSSDYICGKDFTLADIYFYHLITWAEQHNIQNTSIVAEYLKRLESRRTFPEEMLSSY